MLQIIGAEKEGLAVGAKAERKISAEILLKKPKRNFQI